MWTPFVWGISYQWDSGDGSRRDLVLRLALEDWLAYHLQGPTGGEEKDVNYKTLNMYMYTYIVHDNSQQHDTINTILSQPFPNRMLLM